LRGPHHQNCTALFILVLIIIAIPLVNAVVVSLFHHLDGINVLPDSKAIVVYGEGTLAKLMLAGDLVNGRKHTFSIDARFAHGKEQTTWCASKHNIQCSVACR
jgi:hypothetical protein